MQYATVAYASNDLIKNYLSNKSYDIENQR